MKTAKCQSDCKDFEGDPEEHMFTEWTDKDPWVVCTFCKVITQCDPMDAMCGNCHQFRVYKQITNRNTIKVLEKIKRMEK